MNITKHTFIALTILALAGCATYSDLQQRPADYTTTTTKTPESYAQCLLPKLMDTNATSHIVVDGARRIVVVPEVSGGLLGGSVASHVMLTVEAAPAGNGVTRVDMKHMPSLGNFSKQWAQAQSCT